MEISFSALADHAGNGFFNALDWVPVVASAIAVGFLTVPLVTKVFRQYIDLCAAILMLEAEWASWDLYFMPREICAGRPYHALDDFIYGSRPWLRACSRI